jgi:flavin-dependent dehydrogenase
LAGADGVYSKVARSVGLITNRELGIAVEAEVTVPPGDLNAQGQYATFDFGAIPHGYGWIFPKSDHLSVGVFHARKGKVENIRRSLDQFILSQQVLRQCNIKKVRGHHIPLGGVLNDLNRGRILLVGDAANLADPLLGEGIYYAVSSAHIAASVITEQFDFREIDLSQYTYNINNKIVAQFQYARSLANIIYRFPRVGSMILSKSILLQIAFLKLIRGDFTFRQMNKIIVHHLVKTLFLSLRKK